MYLYISAYHLTALSVSGELSATVLPSASNSLPPNAHSTGKLVDLPSPGAWPSDMPIGLPYAFIFCAAANSSSNVSGNLGTPAALKKSGRQFHAAGAWPSMSARHLPSTMPACLATSYQPPQLASSSLAMSVTSSSLLAYRCGSVSRKTATSAPPLSMTAATLASIWASAKRSILASMPVSALSCLTSASSSPSWAGTYELPPIMVSFVPLSALAPAVTGALVAPGTVAAGAAAWQAARSPPAPRATLDRTRKWRRENERGASNGC